MLSPRTSSMRRPQCAGSTTWNQESDTVTWRLSRRESSSSRTARVGSRRERQAIVLRSEAPPAVCWQYYVEPGKRHRHVAAVETGIEFKPNSEGRVATGASSHCAHGVGGDGLREYLDWRPYEYFTCHLSRVEAEGVELFGFVESLETYEFIDLEDGRTEHRWLVRSVDRSPEGMRAFEEATAFFSEISTHPTWGDQMRRHIAEDAAMYGLDRPVG